MYILFLEILIMIETIIVRRIKFLCTLFKLNLSQYRILNIFEFKFKICVMLQALLGHNQIRVHTEDICFTEPCFDYEVKEYLKEASANFIKNYHSKSRESGNKRLRDFILYQCLGSGAFAQVYLAREYVPNSSYIALKLLNKTKVIKDHQEEHVISEKRLLGSVDFPFIIKLYYGFQDANYLCMALEFMQYGELFSFLRKSTCFSEDVSRFYGAQVLLALEYLHHLNIAYRDLKPENILVTDDGYLKIADFGFAKLVPNRTYTLCGTPEYLAPEIILSKGYSRAVDWWAFGVLIFELNAGYSPFVSDRTRRIYEKILANKYNFPKHYTKELRSIIKKLLESDTSKRIGCLKNKVDDVKEHKWFSNLVNWKGLFHRNLKPPQEFYEYQRSRKFIVGPITTLKSSTGNLIQTDFKEF